MSFFYLSSDNFFRLQEFVCHWMINRKFLLNQLFHTLQLSIFLLYHHRTFLCHILLKENSLSKTNISNGQQLSLVIFLRRIVCVICKTQNFLSNPLIFLLCRNSYVITLLAENFLLNVNFNDLFHWSFSSS